jgi:predicted RNA-binding protein YlqC (UPF0109 family)
MSAFDDEFGLFSEGEESERRSTLGARKIAGNETIINDVEPEDDFPRRQGGDRGRPHGRRFEGKPQRRQAQREPADPDAARARAATLLEFVAKKLVEKPDAVIVDNYPPEANEEASIELIVDKEDIGKVIGRGGRVAQALRTIVRATAEGRVGVEIFDTSELEEVPPGDDDAEG